MHRVVSLTGPTQQYRELVAACVALWRLTVTSADIVSATETVRDK